MFKLLMDKLAVFFLTIILSGCASKKEVVQGYSGQELETVLKAVQGKNRKEARKILGNPVMEGKCPKCKPQSYRMIYLTKDMSRFYLGLSYGTDQEIDCLVFDFHTDVKKKEYTFHPKTGLRKLTHCNQKGGAIPEFQMMLDIQ
jgi:hypothetical protein